jgi:hypothetical protein
VSDELGGGVTQHVVVPADLYRLAHQPDRAVHHRQLTRLHAAAGSDLTKSPVRIQEEAPTMEAANALYYKSLAALMKNGDANNTLYEIESIYDYSPEADLPKVRAHVMLINNVEDFADPPALAWISQCAPTARFTSGGRIHPGSCR